MGLRVCIELLVPWCSACHTIWMGLVRLGQNFTLQNLPRIQLPLLYEFFKGFIARQDQEVSLRMRCNVLTKRQLPSRYTYINKKTDESSKICSKIVFTFDLCVTRVNDFVLWPPRDEQAPSSPPFFASLRLAWHSHLTTMLYSLKNVVDRQDKLLYFKRHA